jgi:hypothetical protein
MRLVIEARMIDEGATPTAEALTLAEIERDDRDLTEFGLSLAQGRALSAATQSALVKHQASSWLRVGTSSPSCHAPLRHKDSACIVMRTVFGKVSVGRSAPMVVHLRRGTYALGQPAQPGAAEARHAGTGVPPGEVGGTSVVCSRDPAAQRSPAAAAGHFRRRHEEPRPGCRQGARCPRRVRCALRNKPRRCCSLSDRLPSHGQCDPVVDILERIDLVATDADLPSQRGKLRLNRSTMSPLQQRPIRVVERTVQEDGDVVAAWPLYRAATTNLYWSGPLPSRPFLRRKVLVARSVIPASRARPGS